MTSRNYNKNAAGKNTAEGDDVRAFVASLRVVEPQYYGVEKAEEGIWLAYIQISILQKTPLIILQHTPYHARGQ